MCEPDRQFIAKIEMAMGCRGVGREEVGVKCGRIQGCCEGERPGVRSRRSMEYVALNRYRSEFYDLEIVPLLANSPGLIKRNSSGPPSAWH